MPQTKHKFTSFAAPTPEDLAAFDALSDDAQKAVVEGELAKGFTGETRPLTREVLEDIKAEARRRVAVKHAKTDR